VEAEGSTSHPRQKADKVAPGAATRRNFLANILMLAGVGLSYGVLAAEAVLFVLPRRRKRRVRKIYAGTVGQYKIGTVQVFYDLEGRQILVKRDAAGLKAFSSKCPHLGCRVYWQPEQKRFFCPCHGGVFAADGTAVAGPPATAGQNLAEVPIHVDPSSGIVYLEV